jgi:hypothetical protein
MVPSADSATALPKKSPFIASEAVSSWASVQVPPLSVNTYAEPVWELWYWAPMRAIVPPAEIATEKPKMSPPAPSEAVSFACCE